MKARLKNYSQTPRRVRLVVDLVRGKPLPWALEQLNFLPKRAAGPIRKLLLSAAANAKQQNDVTDENLIIKKVTVDKGLTLKRSQPASRGRVTPIRKRASHVNVELAIKK